ncbi:hypothetical protein ABIA35_003918 [Catenulispora sp. MAP12-49]|uniref:hypothetical protein n=1 Tax=unclassified Catenulispora TaxID=414885 RepID=UPI0035147B1F
MALTSRQKKQGAVATAAVGALAIGGIAVSTLGSSASPTDSRPVAAAAVPQPAAAPAAPASPKMQSPAAAAAAGTVAVTAQADNTKPGDDTVFTVSGEVTGAKPGTKIRLQRQQTTTSHKAASAWNTLAYTTFTDQDGKFSLPVKMETAGSFNLRVQHPQDKEGPQTVYSIPFTVTVSSTAASAKTSANPAKQG